MAEMNAKIDTKFDTEMLEKLARELTATPRLQETAAIAGVGLQLPLARLRRRAVQREGERLAARGDAAGAAAQKARLAMLAAREDTLADELGRRLGPQATLAAGEAALAGRVRRKGVPLAGAELAALDEKGEARARTCTGADGRYALALPADTDLRLALRAGGKAVWRDADTIALPAGQREARNIEVGDALPPCGADDDTPAPAPDSTVQMPSLVGQRLDAAAKALASLGLKLGTVREQADSRVGLVIAQEPKAGSRVAACAEVALVVGSEGKPTVDETGLAGRVRDLAFATALATLGKESVEVASVRLVPGESKTPTVRDARLASDGRSLHLDVALPADGAAEVDVAAHLIAASPEGAALGLKDRNAAAKWLARANVSSFPELVRVAAFDDAALRKRLGLEARAKVAPQRAALLVAASVMVRG